LHAIGNALAVF
jgi:hypothetical protein